jgi:hypothetical protein
MLEYSTRLVAHLPRRHLCRDNARDHVGEPASPSRGDLQHGRDGGIRRRRRELVSLIAHEARPARRGQLNRPSSTTPLVLGRRQGPIDGRSTSQTDSYAAKWGGCLRREGSVRIQGWRGNSNPNLLFTSW